jgi:anhydro-N-acetylmuramic acid kinase
MTICDQFIGLISGTSVDGVDAVLVTFSENRPQLIETHFQEFDSTVREKTLFLSRGSEITLKQLGEADIEIGRLFADATNALLKRANISAESICAIGSHGQTIWHQPDGLIPFSIQIGDPNTIAELTGITTVADFRRRDLSARGQGAPLAPLLHQNCFQGDKDRVIVNIGGISNITVLTCQGNNFAFDTGPGNVLMDYWIHKHHSQTFDVNGEWARSGKVNSDLLDVLKKETYFDLPHPKSTGRELFNGSWLEKKLPPMPIIPEEDVQATLLAFTVKTIESSIKKVTEAQQIFVCGGGAHNNYLMKCLAEALSEHEVSTTSRLGIDPDWVEATAFAWMASETIAGRRIDTTAFTGAKSSVILGGIYQA